MPTSGTNHDAPDWAKTSFDLWTLVSIGSVGSRKSTLRGMAGYGERAFIAFRITSTS